MRSMRSGWIWGTVVALACGVVQAQENFRVASTLQVANAASPMGFGLADFLGDGSRTLIMTSYTWPITAALVPFKAIRIGRDGVLSDVSAQLFDGAVPAQSWSRKVLVTDFNGDGRPDFFSAATGPDEAPFAGEYQTLLLSQANGKLKDVSATNLVPRLPMFVHSAAAADLRKTGQPDLLVGVFNGKEVANLEAQYRNPAAPPGTTAVNYLGPHLLRNKGGGAFTFDNGSLANKLTYFYDTSKNPWTTYDAPGTIDWVEFADLNNDGFPDLIVGAQKSSAVAGTVYFNDGAGGFKTTEYRLPAGLFGAFNTETVDILPFDVNGDGALDLILSQTASNPFYSGSKIQILVNQGNGQFADETALRLPGQTGSGRWVPFLKLVDLDGDGFLDLFCQVDYTEAGQSIAFRNNGQGIFSPMPASYLPALTDSQGVTRSWLTPVDFNRDGRIDFISARRDGGNGNTVSFTLLENTNATLARASTPTGWWWNPAEPGRGYFFEPKAGRVFAAYFLYDTAGAPVWYVSGPGSVAANQFSGSLDQYGNGQSLTGSYRTPSVTGTAGAVSVRFDAPDRATLTWPGGTVSLVRYEIVSGSLNAAAPVVQPETGWWWNPQEGGRGFALEIQGNTLFVAGFMYDTAGKPMWYVSSGAMRNDMLYEGTWQQCSGGQAMGAPFRATSCSAVAGGTLTLRFTSTTTGLLTLPDGRVVALQRYVF